MRVALAAVILLGLPLGCGRVKPPESPEPPAPAEWQDHAGPGKAYTVRFPAPPEKLATAFEFEIPNQHHFGPQTARGTTYRATVNQVVYEFTEYEGSPPVFDTICDRLRGKSVFPVPNGSGDTDLHGVRKWTAEIDTPNPPGRVTLRHIGTNQGKLYELRVTVPAGVDPGETPKAFLDSFRLAPFPLSVAAKIPPFLAAAVDPAAGVMFVTTLDAELVIYDYPAFTQRAKHHLGRVGTRLALDARRGVLWAVLCAPRDVRDDRPEDPRPWDRMRDRGVGRVTALDVGSDLAKKKAADRPKQLAEIPDPVLAGRLTIDPDGRWLYYLDVGDHIPPDRLTHRPIWGVPTKQVRLGRVSLETRQRDQILNLADGTEDLVAPPDGRALYATCSPAGHQSSRGQLDPADPFKRKPLRGLVQVIDPVAFKVADTIEIDADPFSAVASNSGLVYISGGSDQWTDLVVVDTRVRKVVSRWPGISDFSRIDLTPDGKWLALSPHTRPGFVELFDLRRNPLGHDKGDVEYTLQVLQPSDRYGGWEHEKDVGGGVQVTPDGKFILDRQGVILRLNPG